MNKWQRAEQKWSYCLGRDSNVVIRFIYIYKVYIILEESYFGKITEQKIGGLFFDEESLRVVKIGWGSKNWRIIGQKEAKIGWGWRQGACLVWRSTGSPAGLEFDTERRRRSFREARVGIAGIVISIEHEFQKWAIRLAVPSSSSFYSPCPDVICPGGEGGFIGVNNLEELRCRRQPVGWLLKITVGTHGGAWKSRWYRKVYRMVFRAFSISTTKATRIYHLL